MHRQSLIETTAGMIWTLGRRHINADTGAGVATCRD